MADASCDAKTSKKNKSKSTSETNANGNKNNKNNQLDKGEDKEQEDQLHIIISNQNGIMNTLRELKENYGTVMDAMKSLQAKYTILETNLSTVKDDLDGVIKFQGNLNETHEDQKKENQKLKTTIEKLALDNNTLKTENDKLARKLNQTQARISRNSQELNDLQQYGRREMVDISGVPRTRNENTDKIAIAVASLMGVTLEEKDISTSHRESASPKAPIIVKFTTRKTRNLFFENRKLLKNFRVKDLDIAGECKCDSKIYVNESLTPINSEIFRETRYVFGHYYKYIWTHNGITFAKVNKDSTKTFFRSIADIRHMQKRHNIPILPQENPYNLEQNNEIGHKNDEIITGNKNAGNSNMNDENEVISDTNNNNE